MLLGRSVVRSGSKFQVSIEFSKEYTAAAYSCTDSDGGKEYYTKGTLELKELSTGTIQRYGDSCHTIDTALLIELYCEESTLSAFEVTQETHICPNGCKDGACIEVVSESVS